jgi:methenyltetrahydrofolate cyclohydrolase
MPKSTVLRGDPSTVTTLRRLSLEAFLERAASSSPTPGGGTLAAVGGALAAAMVGMTARLTVGRRGYEAVRDRAAELAAEGDAARRALLDLAEADATAYDAVVAAMRLPRDDEAARAARTAALQAAMIEATRVPAAVAERSEAVLGLAEAAAAVAYHNALGDVATAALLGESAMRAAAVQGELNLASIEDATFTAAMATELAPRAAGAPDRVGAILSVVRRRTGPPP